MKNNQVKIKNVLKDLEVGYQGTYDASASNWVNLPLLPNGSAPKGYAIQKYGQMNEHVYAEVLVFGHTVPERDDRPDGQIEVVLLVGCDCVLTEFGRAYVTYTAKYRDQDKALEVAEQLASLLDEYQDSTPAEMLARKIGFYFEVEELF